MALYVFLDWFFIVFHTLFTLFNVLGWIWKRTRLANLVTLSLTGLSWFGLGIWYGWGYCPCTDWHWQVREKLGHGDMPHSYIKFLFDRLTGFDSNETLVDNVVLACFLIAVVASVATNIRDFSKLRNQRNS